jgi:hypothetical protein
VRRLVSRVNRRPPQQWSSASLSSEHKQAGQAKSDRSSGWLRLRALAGLAAAASASARELTSPSAQGRRPSEGVKMQK